MLRNNFCATLKFTANIFYGFTSIDNIRIICKMKFNNKIAVTDINFKMKRSKI